MKMLKMPNQFGVSDTSKREAVVSTSTPNNIKFREMRKVIAIANQEEETMSFTKDRMPFSRCDFSGAEGVSAR